MTDKPCPCHSGRPFSCCCRPVLAGENAVTAEALMRSRYTAYVVGNVNHLLGSRHLSTRPDHIDPANFPKWCGLEIISTEEGGSGDDRGIVEFKASFLSENSIRTLHEKSRFVKENGKWFYVDGDIRPVTVKPTKKTGRNDPCHCGSMKKFKKCCGR